MIYIRTKVGDAWHYVCQLEDTTWQLTDRIQWARSFLSYKAAETHVGLLLQLDEFKKLDLEIYQMPTL